MKELNFKLDYTNMMREIIGDNGIWQNEIMGNMKVAKKARLSLEKSRGEGMLGWMKLPYQDEELIRDIRRTAIEIRQNFDYLVVVGIGGSTLGTEMLFKALCHMNHNERNKYDRKAPKFFILDNVDPDKINNLLDVIDIKKTMFNVITKSGGTSETMSQYMIIEDLLKKELGKDFNKNLIVTTSKDHGTMFKIASANKIKMYHIDEGVGGRFSVLSPVGLLPAAILNIDIRKLLEGAKYIDRKCKKEKDATNPALIYAFLQYIAMNRNLNIQVLMPYSEKLKSFSDWYAQLLAESIGKKEDRNGEIKNTGITPVKALGVIDQHSQVQLYTEGPVDKVITFIAVESFDSDVLIPDGLKSDKGIGFLSGHNISELMVNEQKATEFAVKKAGKLSNKIVIDKVTEETIGALIYFFELSIAYLGEMLNIDAFNQPGVENGKIATFGLMDRKGYEEAKKEIVQDNSERDEYVIK